MVKTYREGPVGALLDEYERAADEHKNVLSDIDSHHFLAIVDHETSDPDCVSVERILNHVVNAGYGYANLIRKQFGDAFTEKIQAKPMQSPQDACQELDQMLHYTAETLENKMQITLEEILNNLITVSWGQQYDFEQLLEHAIVHVLRHRRQIEKFKLRQLV